MTKIVLPGERVTTVTLDGSECAVKFSRPFKAFSLRNDGDTDVCIALESGKSAGDDGVISLSPGASDTYFHGRQLDTCYLFGDAGGKVQVKAQDTDTNSSRKKRKGGNGDASEIVVLPQQYGITDYFDYTQNVNTDEKTWGSIYGSKILASSNDLILSGDHLTVSGAMEYNCDEVYAHSIYTIMQMAESVSGWRSMIGASGTAPQFNLCNNNGKFAIGAGSSSETIETAIPAYGEWHVCCMTLCNGYGAFYIDGIRKGYYSGYHVPQFGNSTPLCIGHRDFPTNIKMLAICKAAHGQNTVAVNSAYLQEKYMIQEVML